MQNKVILTLSDIKTKILSLLTTIVSEMTYNVSMGTLNPTILYYTTTIPL